MNVRIKKLSFKASNKSATDPLEISQGTITILVGPNNSGKSQALRDIESLCTGMINEGKVINQVELDYPETVEDRKELLSDFEILSTQLNHKTYRKPLLNNKKQQIQLQVHEPSLPNNLRDFEYFRGSIIQFYLERLDARTRFSLVEEQPINDLKETSSADYLSTLFKNDRIRKKIRKITKEAFELYFVIDRTGKTLCIRMSQEEPRNDDVERGNGDESIEFHKKAFLINDLGDGIQSFVGLIAGLYSLKDTIILIDEPEAFLAPSIARRLGRELTEITQERKVSLIIATHSADFIVGCIEASNESKIIRLTYQSQKATAREVEPNVIKEFNTNPCLRSSSAIRGLFHKGVIVTEGHRDRVFYDEINRQLIPKFGHKSMEDVLFIDSGGGLNMIYKTLGPLRKMGVPTVAIVDIDFLIKSDPEWENLIGACQIIREAGEQYKKEQAEIVQAFKKHFNLQTLEGFKKGDIKQIKENGIILLESEINTYVDRHGK